MPAILAGRFEKTETPLRRRSLPAWKFDDPFGRGFSHCSANTINPPPAPRPFPNTPPPPPKKSAEALFAALLDLPAAANRERALAEGCAGDDALATEVRALLAAHEAAGDFIPDDAPLSPEIEPSWRGSSRRRAGR